MNTHTPGPWTVDHLGQIIGPRDGCSHEIIAHMPVWFPVAPAGKHATQDHIAANAELLASAPSLRAIVQRLADNSSGEPIVYANLRAQARAALANTPQIVTPTEWMDDKIQIDRLETMTNERDDLRNALKMLLDLAERTTTRFWLLDLETDKVVSVWNTKPMAEQEMEFMYHKIKHALAYGGEQRT